MGSTVTNLFSNNDDGYLFPHSIEDDTREPLFTITVPLFGPSTVEERPPLTAEYGFFLFSHAYWIEMLAFLVVTLSVAAGVGWILYKSVVERKKEGTILAYLVGFGFVLPFWISWPALLLNIFDIRNAIFRFLVGGIVPIICSFRTIETVFGLCPTYITSSANDFCFYYATVPIVARKKEAKATSAGTSQHDVTKNGNTDTKTTTKSIEGAGNPAAAVGTPILCSNTKKLKHLGTFVSFLFLTGALQSFLTPHPYLNAFPYNDSDGESFWYSAERYRSWQLYANSALQAMMFQMYLATYLEALMFAFSLATGYEAEVAMGNALLESQSAMEFWGERWNILVHTVLKNGVYKPLRWKCSVPRDVAVLATFLASGAFHEWILYVLYTIGTESSDRKYTYTPIYGGAMVFFVWQALLIGLELAFGKTVLIKTVADTLPRPLKTALVVAMGLPPAHFFLDPYCRSGFFFAHGQMGLPMILRVR